MSTLNIIKLFLVYLNLHFKASASSRNHVNHSQNSWPWHHTSCSKFWPFHWCHSEPPPIPPPLVPTSPPALLPPLPPLPALPPIPTTLIFADLRLAVVYPIIQRFKSIITSDPLGITKTWVGSDICSYQGFFCDVPPDNATATAVASIDFNGYGLTAPSLDGFLDQLPDLALFHANSNNFGGTISPNIAKLKYLYELDLSNNLFSGPFPLAVVGMESLSFLDIRFNFFFGSVPPAIFVQEDLEVLFLNDNNFISTLPDNLETSHLLYLTLANNRFVGPIPRDIAKVLAGLTQVVLLNNQLTGCLPYELGLLNQVTVLDISNNLLTGPLPCSLACLQSAELLDFSANFLFGMVPDMLCQLPKLANLTLSNNYFTSVGPICWRLIRRGVVDVRNNCIPGLPFQRSIFECAAFFAIPRICNYSDTYKIIPCKLPFH